MGVPFRWKVVVYLIVILIALMAGLPLVYITLSSFKTLTDVRNPTHIIPHPFTLKNYYRVFFKTNALKYLKNSFYIALGTMGVGLLILVPSTYVFARMEFPGKKLIFYAVVLSMLFPLVILLLPISAMFYQAGIYDNIPTVFISIQIIAVPMYLWILRGYFSGFPKSYEEAARVFGCSGFQAFYLVMLPIAKDGILAISFLLFLVGWSDYMVTNTLIFSGKYTSFTMFMYSSIFASERTYWGTLTAQIVICLVPPLILYVLAQKFLGAFARIGQ